MRDYHPPAVDLRKDIGCTGLMPRTGACMVGYKMNNIQYLLLVQYTRVKSLSSSDPTWLAQDLLVGSGSLRASACAWPTSYGLGPLTCISLSRVLRMTGSCRLLLVAEADAVSWRDWQSPSWRTHPSPSGCLPCCQWCGSKRIINPPPRECVLVHPAGKV